MWTIRMLGHAIERVVTCHSTEGERYHLILFLMNIRGSKSYQDSQTVNGKPCTTFKRGSYENCYFYIII